MSGVYLLALAPRHNLRSLFVTPWPVFRGELHARCNAGDSPPVLDALKLRRTLNRAGSVFRGMNDIRNASSSADDDTDTRLSWFRSCRIALLEALDFAVSLEMVLFELRTLDRSCGSHRSENLAFNPSDAACVTCWTLVTAIAAQSIGHGTENHTCAKVLGNRGS